MREIFITVKTADIQLIIQTIASFLSPDFVFHWQMTDSEKVLEVQTPWLVNGLTPEGVRPDRASMTARKAYVVSQQALLDEAINKAVEVLNG